MAIPLHIRDLLRPINVHHHDKDLCSSALGGKRRNCKSSAKGKVHSITGLPQETRKSQINNLTLHLKQLEKEEVKNPRVSRRKEILKLGQK